MASGRPNVDRLRRELEEKLNALSRDLAETEQHLLERRAEVEPVDAPLLPVLKRRKKSPGPESAG